MEVPWGPRGSALGSGARGGEAGRGSVGERSEGGEQAFAALSELLNRIPDVIVVYDVSAGSEEPPRYEFINRSGLATLGQTDVSAVRGKCNLELLGAEARDQIDAFVAEVKAKGQVVTCEHSFPTRTGVRVFHTQYCPLDCHSALVTSGMGSVALMDAVAASMEQLPSSPPAAEGPPGESSPNGGNRGDRGEGDGHLSKGGRGAMGMRPEDVVQVIGVCRDVTERKAMETDIRLALETSRRLERRAIEATQSKTRFLANVSHDLRTPLNGILGSCDLLESALDGRGERHENEEMPELIHFIKTSANLLVNLINDILDVSKLEEGKLELQLGAFSLQRSVEAVMTMVHLSARERSLSIRADYEIDGCGGDVDAVVLLDEGRVTQVLVNLLSNSVKFARPDTAILIHITLRDKADGGGDGDLGGDGGGDGGADGGGSNRSNHPAPNGEQAPGGIGGAGSVGAERLAQISSASSSRAHVNEASAASSWEDGKRMMILEIQVQDEGIGIGEDDLKRLFEPFYQAAQEEHVSAMGTGLGLAITRQLCEMMGGSVRGESEVGKGSTFTVTLPCAVYAASMTSKGGSEAERVTSATAKGAATTSVHPSSGKRKWDGEEAEASSPARARALAAAFSTDPPFSSSLEGACIPQALRDARILIAEDNDISRMLMVKLLRKMGFRDVTTTVNGRELLSTFGQVDPADARTRFDILLLDCRMPHVDGLECVKIIRSKYADDVQPMIAVISADAMIGDRERIMNSGADEYLGKPVTRDAILSMLLRLSEAGEARANKASSL